MTKERTAANVVICLLRERFRGRLQKDYLLSKASSHHLFHRCRLSLHQNYLI